MPPPQNPRKRAQNPWLLGVATWIPFSGRQLPPHDPYLFRKPSQGLSETVYRPLPYLSPRTIYQPNTGKHTKKSLDPPPPPPPPAKKPFREEGRWGGGQQRGHSLFSKGGFLYCVRAACKRPTQGLDVSR